MQIPCPAYRLSQMSAATQTEKIEPEQLQESKSIDTDMSSNKSELEEQIEIVEPVSKEQVIEQQM